MKAMMMIVLATVVMLTACGTSEQAQTEQAGTEQPVAIKTVKMSVDGMTCQGCVNSVQTALTDREGVVDCSVSLSENLAVVAYDPGKVSEKDLLAAVETSGYRATVQQ